MAGFVPEAPAQADNDWQAHLVHYLFDALRGHSERDRPVCRPSPAPVLSRDDRQSCTKGYLEMHQAVILVLGIEIEMGICVIFILNITWASSLFVRLR